MDFQIFFFLSFFLNIVDKRIWQRDLIYPLGLSSTAVSLLKPFFSEISSKATGEKKGKEGRNVSRRCCVLIGRSDDCGFSSFSRGSPCDDSARGRGATNSVVFDCAPAKRNVACVQRISSVIFVAFLVGTIGGASTENLLLSLPLLMLLLLSHAFAETEK